MRETEVQIGIPVHLLGVTGASINVPDKRVSVTYTAVIWTGIALSIVGATAAILGVGGSTAFELAFGDFKVKSTQVGLSIMVIGAALAGVVALKLPAGIKILTEEIQYSFTEKLARKLPATALIVVIVGLVSLLIYSLYSR